MQEVSIDRLQRKIFGYIDNQDFDPLSHPYHTSFMLDLRDEINELLFPQCLHYLLATQKPGGYWGSDYFNPHEAILTTAAVVRALYAYDRLEYKYIIQPAVIFIEKHLTELMKPAPFVGYGLLIGSILAKIRSLLDVTMSDNKRALLDKIIRKSRSIVEKIQEHDITGSYLTFHLEIFDEEYVGSLDAKRLLSHDNSVCGTIPATVALYINTHNDETRAQVLYYIESRIRVDNGVSNFTGDIFGFLFGAIPLWHTMPSDYLRTKIHKQLRIIETFLTPQGIPLSTNFPYGDLDETTAFTFLATQIDYPIGPEYKEIFELYRTHDFATFLPNQIASTRHGDKVVESDVIAKLLPLDFLKDITVDEIMLKLRKIKQYLPKRWHLSKGYTLVNLAIMFQHSKYEIPQHILESFLLHIDEYIMRIKDGSNQHITEVAFALFLATQYQIKIKNEFLAYWADSIKHALHNLEDIAGVYVAKTLYNLPFFTGAWLLAALMSYYESYPVI